MNSVSANEDFVTNLDHVNTINNSIISVYVAEIDDDDKDKMTMRVLTG